MNLAKAAAAIDAATEILREDNDRAERVERLRRRLAELYAAGEKTMPGTSRRLTANLRIIDVQAQLLKIEQDEKER